MSTMLVGTDVRRLRATLSSLLSPTTFDDAERWRDDAAGALRDLVGADAAFIGLHSAHGSAQGLDDAVVRAYERHYRSVDRGIARQHALRLEVWCRRMLWDERELLRSEYYNDFALPNRLYDALGIAAFSGARCVRASLLLASPQRRAAGPGRHAKRLRLLRLALPAFRVGTMLGLRWQHWRESIARIVDRVAQPLVLCSASGEVLHENPSLVRETALEHADELQEAIRRVGRAVAGPARVSSSGIVIPADVCVPTARWDVVGSRVAGDDAGAAEPAILIALAPRGSASLPVALLHARYGLTTREVQVLELLRQRHSNPEIATLLRISAHTARHHTEHVLLKLGLPSRRLVAARCAQLAREAGGEGGQGGQGGQGS